MNLYRRHSNGIPAKSARELVAQTVVIHRWQRDFLLALAGEQQCTPSAVLRVLLDQALGPAPEEVAPPARPEEAAPVESNRRSQDEPAEPEIGRSIRLQPRHREVLAAFADRRAVSLSALLGAILDSWLQAHLDACD